MSISSLSSGQLRQVVKLIKQKEGLIERLAKVNAALAALERGSAAQDAPSGKKTKVRRRRAGLKPALVKKLAAAGPEGMTVQDLAVSLKTKPARVSIWFYTTGKKVKGIKKVGRGRYAYVGA